MRQAVHAIMMRVANVFAALSVACGVVAVGLLWRMTHDGASGNSALEFGFALAAGFLAGCAGFAMASARPVSGALSAVAIGCAGTVFGALSMRYVFWFLMVGVAVQVAHWPRATTYLALPLGAGAAFVESLMLSREGPLHALSGLLACLALGTALAPNGTRSPGARLLAAAGLLLCGVVLGAFGLIIGGTASF